MTPGRPLRVAAFACAAGLIAACGGASDDAVDQDATGAPTAAETAPVQTDGPDETGEAGTDTDTADATDSGAVVPASLQFTAPLIGGGEIVGDALAGKPTAFWFWSPT